MTIPFISKLQGGSHDDAVHPARDWFIMLAVVLAVLIASGAWNLWLFYQIMSGKSLGGAVHEETQQAKIQVQDVQDVFKNRAAERANYQNTYTFVDPSALGS